MCLTNASDRYSECSGGGLPLEIAFWYAHQLSSPIGQNRWFVGALSLAFTIPDCFRNPGIPGSRDYKDNEIQMIYIIPIAQLILYQCLVYLFVFIMG